MEKQDKNMAGADRNKALISVIVPVYNCSDYIEECCAVLMGQSYANIEIILVDDGSKDGSGEKCDRLASKDQRIRVFHQLNGGASSARNRGLDEAKGEWITFVDADDSVNEDYLETMYDLVSPNIDSVVCGYDCVDECGTIHDITPPHQDVIVDAETICYWFYHPKYFFQNFVWGRLFRASVIQEHHIRFDEKLKIIEDTPFCAQFVMASSKKVCYTFQSLYHHHSNPESLMSRLTVGAETEQKYVDGYIKMFRVLSSPKFLSFRISFIARWYVYVHARRLERYGGLVDMKEICNNWYEGVFYVLYRLKYGR